MHRSILFLFFALFTTAFAAYQPKNCNKGNKKTDAAYIKTKFTNARGFCNYYLSSSRSRIPINGKPFNGKSNDGKLIKRFNNACECIAKKKASDKKERSIKNPGKKAKCVQAKLNALEAAVKAPAPFCRQWRSVDWRPENQAPFGKSLKVRDIYNACVCVLDPAETTAPTTSATASATVSVSATRSASASGSAVTSSVTTSASASVTVAPVTTSSPTASASTTANTGTISVTTTSAGSSTSSSSTAIASPSAVSGGSTKKKMAMRLRGRQYSNAGAGKVDLE